MNFRSGREGVQIEEKNSANRIYKAAAIKKAILLQCVSSPFSEFSLLISWWEVLVTPKNMAQQMVSELDYVEGERDARR